jgi:hypothetical protein
MIWRIILSIVIFALLKHVVHLIGEGDFSSNGWAWDDLRLDTIVLFVAGVVVWLLRRQYRALEARRSQDASL